MKELKSFTNGGLITRYNVEDIDIDEFKKIAEKIGNDRDGLGAAVAESKSKIVNSILGKMFNKTPWSVELQFKSWDRDILEPIYDDEIEKILADNFNFFKTKGRALYLAPKKTSKASVKNWLTDDYRGTMENPYW